MNAMRAADYGLDEDDADERDGGVKNNVGLCGPMNGTPACGSGICGTTCHKR